MQESRMKDNESAINVNLKKLSNKKKIIQIKNAGINARILLVIVFLEVKTFNP